MPRAKKKAAKTTLRAVEKKDADKIEAGEDGQEPVSKFRRPPVEETDEDPVGKNKVQKRLPTMQRRTNKELEKLALEVNEVQTERIALQQREQQLREKGAELMEKLKLEEYDLPGGLVAEFDVKKKFKVHAKKGAGADED